MVMEELTWSRAGWVVLLAAAACSVVPLGWVLLTVPTSRPSALVPLLLVVLLVAGIGAVFHRLRVTLGPDTLTVGFGPFRERLPLARIAACEPTTYRWLAYGGYGIRYNFWRRAKLYNVPGDGGRAVELTLDDGRRVLFSARDPVAVCAALRSRCPNLRTEDSSGLP
jgi:hypothetical protein